MVSTSRSLFFVSGSVVLSACTGTTEETLYSCSADSSPLVSTVVTVSWPEAWEQVDVRYGRAESLDLGAEPVSETSARLTGLPAGEKLHYRVSATLEGESVGCEGSLWLNEAPTVIPDIRIDSAVPAAIDQDALLLTSVFSYGDRADLLMIDRQGRVFWYYEGRRGEMLLDVQLDQSGDGLIFNRFDGVYSEDIAVIRRISITGELIEEVRTELGHHMFEQLPDGTLAYQVLDVRSWTDPDTGEEMDLVGDAIFEVSADGTHTEIFNVWDWLEPVWNVYFTMPGLYPYGTDWTHGNSIQYSEEDDSYLLSLGNAGVLIDIDRATGVPNMMYGAEGIPVSDTSTGFSHQHDAQWLENGNLLMFSTHPSDFASGAIEYGFDPSLEELVEVWNYGMEDGPYAVFLGQATRLDNGNTLVNFGGAGELREVTPSGEIVWHISLPEGHSFGQAILLPEFPD